MILLFLGLMLANFTCLIIVSFLGYAGPGSLGGTESALRR